MEDLLTAWSQHDAFGSEVHFFFSGVYPHLALSDHSLKQQIFGEILEYFLILIVLRSLEHTEFGLCDLDQTVSIAHQLNMLNFVHRIEYSLLFLVRAEKLKDVHQQGIADVVHQMTHYRQRNDLPSISLSHHFYNP